jgi:hypothetical protein
MLWKVNGNGRPLRVEQTRLSHEDVLEEQLENWIQATPAMLGEPLLFIGRQVQISDVKDRIDLLALDTAGNLVVVELKRGSLKDPVDMQALRYASYVSRWGYDQIAAQAKTYFSGKDVEDLTLDQRFTTFCEEAGAEDPDVDYNREQRIIIVGQSVRDKLGSVALWLLKHRIDIKIVEVGVFRDGKELLLSPNVVIPPPTSEKFELGKQSNSSDEPWIRDGEHWHTHERCGPEAASLLRAVIKNVLETVPTGEPSWNQKYYVSIRKDGGSWMAIRTHRNMLVLDIRVNKTAFQPTEVATRLGLVLFQKEADLAEKLELPSSISIAPQGTHDRIRLRLKEEFDLASKSEAFGDLVRQTWTAAAA